MTSSALSEVFWEVIEQFYDTCACMIMQFRGELIVEIAEMYAEAVSDLGSPMDNCIGFIDCTKIQMSRPGGTVTYQRSFYSGHKRFH